MKIPHIAIISLTVVLCLITFSQAHAISYMPPQDLYKQSDMVFYGQVISKQTGPGPDYNYYQIKVETYFKNPQNSDSITVAGHKPDNKTRMSYPQFEAGDKAIFYINKIDGINTISPYSQIAGEACGIHSFLGPAPIPGEPIERGVPAGNPRLTDVNGNALERILTNHEVTLSSEDIFNNYPEARTISVVVSIQNEDNGQQIFNRTQNLEMQACSWAGIVKWSFVPTQIGNYVATISVDNNTKMTMGFNVIYDYNFSNSEFIFPPLKQFKSGIESKNVTCKEGLHLMIKSEDGSPACIYTKDAVNLFERGWTKQVHYYIDKQPSHEVYSYVQPKVRLPDYFYDGMDTDGIVTINNKTYHQTTFNYTVDNLPKGRYMKFQNVTFTFPEGILNTPGGSFVPLDVKFSDGSEEVYGGIVKFPDNVTGYSGISIPTMYGPSIARNTVTVIGSHIMPQAGLTIYHDKFMLLVSK